VSFSIQKESVTKRAAVFNCFNFTASVLCIVAVYFAECIAQL
jgi:hypothetical protein